MGLCNIPKVSQRERDPVYTITIPVSNAQRDTLCAAGLAGAKILFLFIPLGVDLEELPGFPL